MADHVFDPPVEFPIKEEKFKNPALRQALIKMGITKRTVMLLMVRQDGKVVPDPRSLGPNQTGALTLNGGFIDFPQTILKELHSKNIHPCSV